MVNVALLGTGDMGAPMARNVARGFDLRVWNRSRAKADPLADVAVVCDTIAEAVADADVIMTMLSDDTVVEAVLFDDGVVGAAKTGACLVDMSSIQPHRAREFAGRVEAAGLRFLDAPVSGGVVGATNATMVILVGGEAVDFAVAEPVFDAMGRATLLGPHGAGQVGKLANQIIVGITFGAVSEAMILAAECGCDPAALVGALQGGFASSILLEMQGKNLFNPDWTPRSGTGYLLKDLNNSLEKADEVGLSLPLTKRTFETEAAMAAFNKLNPKGGMVDGLHAVYAQYYKA